MRQKKLRPLDQQVIVITGASSGIGLVTAKAAAARGATVFLIARGAPPLIEAVREIEQAGGKAAHAVADVGDLAELTEAADEAVRRFGRIDSWVSNAGVAIYASLMDTPADAHERMFRTNYFGAVHSATIAVPHLRERGGALITVASIAAALPTPVMGAYAASKHAVKAYVEALRMELRDAAPSISVSLVVPSGIDTPIAEHALVRMEGAGRIPPPPYDPALVAQAILACAEHRHREVTVGGVGKAQILFAQTLPRLYEWLAPKVAVVFVDKDKAQPRPSNLFAPARDGAERSVDQAGRTTSFTMWAQLHPRTVAALTIGAGALLTLAAGRARSPVRAARPRSAKPRRVGNR